MSPESRGVLQVWQTPVRQLQRVGTSQASARSSTLCVPAGKGVEMPLRAKVTSGPVPGRAGGLVRCPAGLPGEAGVDRGPGPEQLGADAVGPEADGDEGVAACRP